MGQTNNPLRSTYSAINMLSVRPDGVGLLRSAGFEARVAAGSQKRCGFECCADLRFNTSEGGAVAAVRCVPSAVPL
jgi:hypothetical protein